MESKRGNRMKKFIIAIAALLTSASVIASPSLGAVNKLGGTCTKVGTISGALICQKSGSKLLWAKYSAPKPAPSSADYITPQVLAALKVTKLPANLTPPIAKVPTDKSFWLDQACSVDFADVKTPDCQAGDPKGTKIMVVYGDSHASMWMTALNQIAIDSGYKICVFENPSNFLCNVSMDAAIQQIGNLVSGTGPSFGDKHRIGTFSAAKKVF